MHYKNWKNLKSGGEKDTHTPQTEDEAEGEKSKLGQESGHDVASEVQFPHHQNEGLG